MRLTNNSGRSREQILESSGSKPSSIFESHCEKGCSLSMWLTCSRILRTKNCVLIGITENEEFSEENWTNLDIDRRNICRGILTDYTYVLVKETVSPMHETAASHLVGSICAAIIRQLLLNPGQMPHEAFRLHGSGSRSLGLSLWLTLGLKFERFGGEPDGGIGWAEEKLPFVFLEVGVSDSKSKTVNRVRHWLSKAKGKAFLCSKFLLICSGKTWHCHLHKI